MSLSIQRRDVGADVEPCCSSVVGGPDVPVGLVCVLAKRRGTVRRLLVSPLLAIVIVDACRKPRAGRALRQSEGATANGIRSRRTSQIGYMERRRRASALCSCRVGRGPADSGLTTGGGDVRYLVIGAGTWTEVAWSSPSTSARGGSSYGCSSSTWAARPWRRSGIVVGPLDAVIDPPTGAAAGSCSGSASAIEGPADVTPAASGLAWATVIHPRATIGPNVEIGSRQLRRRRRVVR